MEEKLIEQVVADLLWKKKLTVAVAESCTGGLISHRLTNIPGSSYYFDAGVVSYSNESKMKILEVEMSSLLEFGAVSEEVAVQMAKGVRKITDADIGISTTGICGPEGGSEEKPVGLVYVAIDYLGKVKCDKCLFSGERKEIKQKTADYTLNLLKERLRYG